MLLRRIAAADDDGGRCAAAGAQPAAAAFLTACCQMVRSFDSAGGFSITSAAPRSSPLQTALRAGAPGSARRMSGRRSHEAQRAEAAAEGSLDGARGSTREDWRWGCFRARICVYVCVCLRERTERVSGHVFWPTAGAEEENQAEPVGGKEEENRKKRKGR